MSRHVSVPLEAALLGFVERAAERESRTVAGQIRHLIVEAMRHTGDTTAGSDPWPPPLALVSRDNLSEIKARVNDMEVRRAPTPPASDAETGRVSNGAPPCP